MPLIQQKPSDETRSALKAGLKDFVKPGDPVADALLNAPAGIPVFTLTLKDIQAAVEQMAMKPAGWQFLARTSTGETASADVSEPKDGKIARMTGFSRDPRNAVTLRAIQEAESLPEVQSQSYEVWILRIPGVLTEALLLKSLTGNSLDDLIVPVVCVQPGVFEKLQAYPMAKFVDTVRPLIQRFLQFGKLELADAEYKKA